MEGFIVFDYEKQYPTALRDLAQWLSEGKIKRRETIVTGGIDKAEIALADLYRGANTGESLIFAASPEFDAADRGGFWLTEREQGRCWLR